MGTLFLNLKRIMLMLFAFGFFKVGYSQNVTHYYINIPLLASPTNICAGDTVEVKVSTNCVCGFPRWINEHDVFVNSCSWNCEIESTETPTIQGPDIVWHSSPPAPIDCNLPGYNPSCLVTPTQTSTYTISWEKTYTKDEGYCGPYFYESETTIWHYTGQVTVTVDEAPVPELATNKTHVAPGEQYTLSVPNCEANGQFPDFYVYIKEQCQTGDGTLYNCNNNSFTKTAPNYPTTLIYKAKMKRADPPWCQSEWSPEVKIVVEAPVDPDPCGEPVIPEVEDMLSTVDPDNPPADFHSYVTIRNLPSNCNLGAVWSNYISSNENAQPQSNDMVTDPTNWFGTRNVLNYIIPPAPAQHCSDYNIFSASNMVVKLAPFISSRINPALGEVVLGTIEAICPDFFSTNVLADPIKVVIDHTTGHFYKVHDLGGIRCRKHSVRIL